MTSLRKLSAISSLLLLAAVSGCGSGSEGGTTALTYASYGGTFEDGQKTAWQEPYTEETGVQFANTSPSDTSMIKAQVDSGNVQWDIADTDPFFAAENCETYVEKFELPNVDASQYDDDLIGDCYFGTYQFANIMSYNSEKWPDPKTAPHSVEDFFDTEKFPGKRGVVTDVTNGMLEYALLADGVEESDLYPLDTKRAFKKWDSIKADTTFADNNGAMLQLATNKQVDMMILVSARTKAALDEGAPFTPIWDTTMSTFHTFVIPKGSPNKDEAIKFIESVLEPQRSAAFAEAAGVAPTNKDALPDLDANGEKINAYDPKVNDGSLITVDSQWWGENLTQTSADFANWVNG